MKVKTAGSILLIFGVVFFAARAAIGAPMKVTLDKVQGTVEYKADDAGAWKAAKSGDAIPVGATVKTGADGTCILKWAQGNAVKITPLTVLRVDEADRTGAAEKSSLNLKEGKAFAHAKKLASPDSSFQVKTPTAVAGVRGTDLFGMVEGGQSTFGVSDGVIAVEAGGIEMLVETGLSVIIDELGTMTEPAPIPDEIKEEVNQHAEEVRQEAQIEATAPPVDEKPAADETKTEEVAAPAVTDVIDTIDRVLETDITNTLMETIQSKYITGTVEVDIVLPEISN